MELLSVARKSAEAASTWPVAGLAIAQNSSSSLGCVLGAGVSGCVGAER